MYKLTNSISILRLSDGASIPADTDNNDYVDYLRWLSNGNTPTPADTPDPKLQAAADIQALESGDMISRLVREYLLADLEAKAVKSGVDPRIFPAYVKLKARDEQISALRVLL